MALSSKHDAVLDQLVAAFLQRDAALVREIVLDDSHQLYETLFLVAFSCVNEDVDAFHLSRMISDTSYSLESDGARMAKNIGRGDLQGVVLELSSRTREVAATLVAIVCSIEPTAANMLWSHFEYIDEHPELLGSDL